MDSNDAKPTEENTQVIEEVTAPLLPPHDSLVSQLQRKLTYTTKQLAQTKIERDAAQKTLDEAESAHDHVCVERDAYAKQVEALTKERDMMLSEREGWRKIIYAVLAAAPLANSAHDELVQTREVLRQAQVRLASADDSGLDVAPISPCPHSKAKQYGPATFVARRCKLADGHDGMCEPV